MSDEQRQALVDAVAAALGDGWSMDNEEDKAAAVAAIVAVLAGVDDGS